MTVERSGLFTADSEGAELLAVYDFDPEDYPHFIELFTILEKLVLAKTTGSYLIYANAETMLKDEQEARARGFYYSISVDELQTHPSTVLPVDELEAFTLLARGLHKEAAEEDISEAELTKVVEEFRELARDADEKKAYNLTLSVGEKVHVRAPAGDDYPRSTLRLFDPGLYDARKVLKDSDVDYSRGKRSLTIYPLPPHLRKSEGKYWGEFKDESLGRAYFAGSTKKALEEKASVYLAWTEKFGATD